MSLTFMFLTSYTPLQVHPLSPCTQKRKVCLQFLRTFLNFSQSTRTWGGELSKIKALCFLCTHLDSFFEARLLFLPPFMCEVGRKVPENICTKVGEKNNAYLRFHILPNRPFSNLTGCAHNLVSGSIFTPSLLILVNVAV